MIEMGNIIAQRLHDIVKNGTLGIDYTLAGLREKNLKLRRDYFLDDSKMIAILLELNESHFVRSEPCLWS